MSHENAAVKASDAVSAFDADLNPALRKIYKRHERYIDTMLSEVLEINPDVPKSTLVAMRERHTAFLQESVLEASRSIDAHVASDIIKP